MTKSESRRVYWDSCAWIGLLNNEADKACELRAVYERAKNGKCEIWTSVFSLVEVYKTSDEKNQVKPLGSSNMLRIEGLFNQSFVKLIQLDREIAEWARNLVRTTPGLKKHQDSIHLASALAWNIPVMHTYDRNDLLHLSNSFKCRNGENLFICNPGDFADTPLFKVTR